MRICSLDFQSARLRLLTAAIALIAAVGCAGVRSQAADPAWIIVGSRCISSGNTGMADIAESEAILNVSRVVDGRCQEDGTLGAFGSSGDGLPTAALFVDGNDAAIAVVSIGSADIVETEPEVSFARGELGGELVLFGVVRLEEFVDTDNCEVCAVVVSVNGVREPLELPYSSFSGTLVASVNRA